MQIIFYRGLLSFWALAERQSVLNYHFKSPNLISNNNFQAHAKQCKLHVPLNLSTQWFTGLVGLSGSVMKISIWMSGTNSVQHALIWLSRHVHIWQKSWTPSLVLVCFNIVFHVLKFARTRMVYLLIGYVEPYDLKIFYWVVNLAVPISKYCWYPNMDNTVCNFPNMLAIP